MAKVELYTKDYCPYCNRALDLFESKGVDFTNYDVTHDEDKWNEMNTRSNGGKTVPQIFIDDKHVGGCDDVMALDKSGKLDALLA